MNSHEVFIHIHQGCFAGTGAIVRLPQCQWSKPDGYCKISRCITTTKHSKAKTACIFLGIYCSLRNIVQWKNTLTCLSHQFVHTAKIRFSSYIAYDVSVHVCIPSITVFLDNILYISKHAQLSIHVVSQWGSFACVPTKMDSIALLPGKWHSWHWFSCETRHSLLFPTLICVI